MKTEISLLAGLKNNLDYSKSFYQHTRELYPDTEIVFVSYNSTDGTHEWLDSLVDEHLIYYYADEPKTFSDTFNKCVELATREYVVFTHNDVVLTPNFVENIAKYASKKLVVYYTTIEPPVFSADERPGKIVRNFGEDVASFDKGGLYKYSIGIQLNNKDAIIESSGTSFFLCVQRQVLMDIGGLDNLFDPMFCEDDDLILRLRLHGLKTMTALDAVCYHYVSKTSRFSEEYQLRTSQIEANSNRNFVRKWGFRNSAAIKKKYDTGCVVHNCTEAVIAKIEPFCSTMYVDCDFENYINKEQPLTAINLRERLKTIDSEISNDILITVNGDKLNTDTINKIFDLSGIIFKKLTGRQSFIKKLLGNYKFNFRTGNLHIRILKELSHEDELVFRKKLNAF